MRSTVLLLVAALLAFAPGCGHGQRGTDPLVGEHQRPPPIRNADRLARAAVAGKIATMVQVAQLAAFPSGRRLLSLPPWGTLLAELAIDPGADLDRVFIAAPELRAQRDAAMVIEHRLPADRVTGLLAQLVQPSRPVGRLHSQGVPIAEINFEGHPYFVAAVQPHLLVALPLSKGHHLGGFMHTGGLPELPGSSLALGDARDPGQSMRAPGVPRIPDSVREISFILQPATGGGYDLNLDGRCDDPRQARKAAADLSRQSRRAVSVPVLGPIRMQLAEGIDFRAVGERITAQRRLTPTEVNVLLNLIERQARH